MKKTNSNAGGVPSVRERQVAEHVSRGLINKQIACELGLTEGTVKQYMCRLARKLRLPLGCGQRALVTRWWIEHEERKETVR